MEKPNVSMLTRLLQLEQFYFETTFIPIQTTKSHRLSLTSLGGPVAHLAFLKEAYVDQHKWLTDKIYADVIVLCQFFTGLSSSQVGISIGILRDGLLAGIVTTFDSPHSIVIVKTITKRGLFLW